jgi:hypothetical protein
LNAVVRCGALAPIQRPFVLAVGMLWTGEEGEARLADVAQEPSKFVGRNLIIGVRENLRYGEVG